MADVSNDDWFQQNSRPIVKVKEHVRGKSAFKRATEALPAIGGAIGGLVGTPGGAVGRAAAAGFGGAGGEAAKQIAERIGGYGGPETSGEAAKLIGESAASQAAQQAGGELLSGALKFGGNLAGRLAYRAAPEVVQTAAREGIAATKAGLRKLVARIAETAGAERSIVRAAAGKGLGWTDPKALSSDVFQRVAKKLEGAPQSEISKLSALEDQFLREHQQDISPVKLLALRKYNDLQTAGVRQAVKRGAVANPTVEQRWEEALADAARERLQIAIPSINDPVAYQRLTGKATIPSALQRLREVAFPAERRAGAALSRAARYGALPAAGAAAGAIMAPAGQRSTGAGEGAAIGAILSHPAVLSQLSLLSQNPVLAQILRQLPRAVGLAAEQ